MEKKQERTQGAFPTPESKGQHTAGPQAGHTPALETSPLVSPRPHTVCGSSRLTRAVAVTDAARSTGQSVFCLVVQKMSTG